MSVSDSIKLTILKYSYWETYKHSKDLSFTLPLNHPRRVELEKSTNDLLIEMNNLEAKMNKPKHK